MEAERPVVYLRCVGSGCEAAYRSYVAQCENFCESCGKELHPCPTCLCGREFNPKSYDLAKFCGNCGREWSPLFIAQRLQEREETWAATQAAVRAFHAQQN